MMVALCVMEYDKVEYTDAEYDEGYSEKQSALDTEIQTGGWRNLKKFTVYQTYSRQQKIFVTYQALSNDLCHIISMYLLTTEDEYQKVELLTEFKKLRMIQDILLNCLLWEHSGNLEKDMIPLNVWELIE